MQFLMHFLFHFPRYLSFETLFANQAKCYGVNTLHSRRKKNIGHHNIEFSWKLSWWLIRLWKKEKPIVYSNPNLSQPKKRRVASEHLRVKYVIFYHIFVQPLSARLFPLQKRWCLFTLSHITLQQLFLWQSDGICYSLCDTYSKYM